MTDPVELIRRGVVAICRVPVERFNDKHWGAAAVAAGLLAGDRSLPAETRAAIVAQADRMVEQQSAWFPTADPTDDPSLATGSTPASVADAVEALSTTAGRLHLLGHDVIFASLALRAMADHPELTSPSNVAGLVHSIRFAGGRGPGGPFPGWDDPGSIEVGPRGRHPRGRHVQPTGRLHVERVRRSRCGVRRPGPRRRPTPGHPRPRPRDARPARPSASCPGRPPGPSGLPEAAGSPAPRSAPGRSRSGSMAPTSGRPTTGAAISAVARTGSSATCSRWRWPGRSSSRWPSAGAVEAAGPMLATTMVIT